MKASFKKYSRDNISRDYKRNKYVYFMALPVIAFYLLFHYTPMYGAIIAFKDFMPNKGIIESPWVGIKHFLTFFNGIYIWRLIRNTFLISLFNLIFGFPAPVIFALLLNEIGAPVFKRISQTLSYLPHFISMVVIASLVLTFTSSAGLVNDIIVFFAGEGARSSLLQKPENFRMVYVISEIWQGVGWGSIIYLAAISGLDQEGYEAAVIDGANRLQRCLHITLPGIFPTVIILFILRMGTLMNVGFEKVMLLYNPGIYETADVISTYVYRRGILDTDWSFSAAVGLFNSVVNFTLVVSANWISRKVSDTNLW